MQAIRRCSIHQLATVGGFRIIIPNEHVGMHVRVHAIIVETRLLFLKIHKFHYNYAALCVLTCLHAVI